MGTCGLFGIIKGENLKATAYYNNGMPDCLGKQIIKFIRKNNFDKLSEFFDLFIPVKNNDEPTNEELAYCIKTRLCEIQSFKENPKTWINVLSKSVWDFIKYQKCLDKNKKIYMTDDCDFMTDYECRYAYIINLDNETLDIYYCGGKEPTTGFYLSDIWDDKYTDEYFVSYMEDPFDLND